VHTKIDLANLDALELGGKVGIDGCQVVKAPAEVTALASSESLVQTVEVPPDPPGSGNPGVMTFIVGPDSPDFVPFDKISPHLINAVMTTEDSGFFKHRGWVSPVFKTALRRNIENGGFRLGASSITMQMVKNLLLSKEKTLSRKLQELFLVWYLEQILPKERILELYFNAIEFGPRLYGIGPAARHYFGKSASDITPLEAAFFSSILPSPKRRYVHYCHGALSPAWEKYLRRILTRMYERGRLTEEEYAGATASTLTFDHSEMTLSEKQCLDWVRRITVAKPEVEAEADADSQ
jgi:membrane peptidoglycan carboxypeptidase